MDQKRYQELKGDFPDISGEVSDEELDEFFDMMKDNMEVDEEEQIQVELEEIDKDIWECRRCGEVFKYRKNEIPPICEGCSRERSKTQLIAKSGIYKYFDLRTGAKPTFVPRKLADDIMEDFNFLTMKDNEDIYYYEDGYYKYHGEENIKSIAQNRLKDESRRNRIKEVVSYIKHETYHDREELYQDNILVLENGVYDLDEDEFKEPSPEYKSLTKLPIEYDPDAKCPKIKEFISNLVHDEDIRLIQEMIGYILTKEHIFEKAFMLYGSGANGKTTFLNLLDDFIGKTNTSGVKLQDLHRRFQKQDLFGSLLNKFADLPSKKLRDT